MSVRDGVRSGVALLIGIGDYLLADKVGSLRFATQDARALAEVLVEPEVCAFPPERVHLMTGAEARRDAMVSRLSKWLPEASRGAEIVFLSFAGHGAVHRVGQRDEGFLLPYDADPDDLVTRGVAMSDLARWIEGIEAEAVVVCLDCCHAARVITRQGNAGPVEVRDMKIRPTLLQGLAGKGRHLFASCDEGQVSVEVERLGHGLFTYHLLRGLRGEADRDRNGRVDLSELFEFVAEEVEREAKALGYVQKPWKNSTGPGGVYLSRRLERRRQEDGTESPGRPREDEENADAIEDARRALTGNDIARLIKALEWFRRTQHPEVLPYVFKPLTHASGPVRDKARQALKEIAWKQTVGVIENLARRSHPGSDSEAINCVLEGLAAYEAHSDVVVLLDRIVSLLRGDLRNQAIFLLERKRLALGLEDVNEIFRELQSPYRLQRVLGQGLFTGVYLARDEEAEHDVVVRVLRPEFAAQPHLRSRFLDLGRSAIRLVHQNLVLTREVRAMHDRHIYFLVRDYVHGITLQKLLDSGKSFTPAQILTILRQLLQALSPLHAAGWPHGGIKPSNVFICGDDRVVLGDPALPVGEISLAFQRLSYDYRYVSPEVFRDGGVVGPASDLYAVGCVAHELACGAPPFVSDNPMALASMHVRDPVVAPSRRGSRLERDGDPLLLRLLAKTAEERYANIDEALAAIAALSAGPRPIPAPSRIIPGPATPPGIVHADAAPMVGEESMVRYDPAQSIVRFEDRSDVASTVDPTPSPEVEVSSPARQIRQIGPYVIRRIIGEGGMGAVYLAQDERLDRPVAIKIIKPHSGANLQASRRFFVEARAVAGLTHPNIVAIHDVGEHDGGLYTVLEYLEGGNLRQKIAEQPLAVKAAVELMILMARAAHYAHERGIVHRDLKPSNILLTREGVPKIADFGLAKLLDDRADEVGATMSGAILGTPAYMAPEQAMGRIDRIGPASDIFSLGGILYELLTSRRPFEGNTALAMLHHVVNDTPGPPSRLRPGIPRRLDEICLKCLDKEPRKRYPDAASLAGDLEELLRDDRRQAQPTQRRSGLWRRLFPG